MRLFLIIATVVFFISGTMLLLTPKIFKKISGLTDHVLFKLENKLGKVRRPLGIIFLAISIFTWYIVLYK